MLIGADAPLLSWSELPSAELRAEAFRIPHHGGALDDGGTPAGWSVRRLYAEPQYRHLTDKRGQIEKGRLEVPCAGTVVVKLHLDGRVDVLPSRGGEHERIVDDWQHPLCRPPAL